MSEWQPIETAPIYTVVETKLDDEKGERNVGPLKQMGRLWHTPDGAMYVYYTPTHWRHIEPTGPDLDRQPERVKPDKSHLRRFGNGN